jgi:hypothetical protein
MRMPEQEAVDPQLYQQMDKKDTEELLAMWHEHDRDAWTDQAFAAIHAVLLNRLGSIPEPSIPLTEDDIDTDEEETLLASENLLFLATWANRLARLILALALLMFFLRIIQDYSRPFPSFPGPTFWLMQLSSWVSYFYSLSIGVAYFVLLKALSLGAHFLISRNQD